MKKPKNEESPVLKVENLNISFSRYDRGWNKYEFEVIHSMDVEIYSGEILAVVGASGSGKSLLASSIFGILPDNAKLSGSIEFKGKRLSEEMKKNIRGKKIVLIPQSIDFLDPLMKVGKQICGADGNRKKMKKVMETCGLKDDINEMYPFQLSGGMARRVLISTAFMEKAELVIADEPTPGLDDSLVSEILKNFRRLADKGCAVMMITHDISVALEIADRIAVFYAGTTVEVCPASDFREGKKSLRHPYSKAFLDALPQNGFKAISGTQPFIGEVTGGCLFYDRCPEKTKGCKEEIEMRKLRGGKVRCINAT